MKFNQFCMRGSLYYAPQNRYRPLTDITQCHLDDYRIPFNETDSYKVHVGFYTRHKECYATDFSGGEYAGGPIPERNFL